MRHIQIKILAIIVTLLISVSSYGQMQQVLKNGFVAATDDGVYYLQDGFSEWVKFKKPRYTNSFHFTNEAFDTVNFVSYNSNRLMIASYSYYIESGGNSYNSGRNNSEIYNNGASRVLNYSYRSDGADLGNIFNVAFGVDDRVRYYSYNLYSNYYYRIEKYGTTEAGDYLTTNSLNSIAIADSVICIVGNGNTLIKHTINKTDINSSYISVSGLHSRPTDSHQICYNPDDDEFIIVSDSGIVYSYDKTTLTTIDTIPTIYGNEIVSIEDVKYSHERNYYVIALREIKNAVPVLRTYVTTDFTSYTGKDYGGDNTATLCTGYNGYIYIIDIFGHISRINEANNQNVMPRLLNVSVFDLDYINYMP